MSQVTDIGQKFLTRREAAARCSSSLDFIDDCIADGRLPAYRASRKMVRVLADDVDALFKPMNSAAVAARGGAR